MSSPVPRHAMCSQYIIARYSSRLSNACSVDVLAGLRGREQPARDRTRPVSLHVRQRGKDASCVPRESRTHAGGHIRCRLLQRDIRRREAVRTELCLLTPAAPPPPEGGAGPLSQRAPPLPPQVPLAGNDACAILRERRRSSGCAHAPRRLRLPDGGPQRSRVPPPTQPAPKR